MIKEIEKQIKRTEKKERFFDKLAGNMHKVKCGVAICFAGLVISTVFMPAIYYCIFGALGLVSGIDLIVESQTNYGENICDNLSKKYSKQVRELKKQKESLERVSVSHANKEEIRKTKKELGLDDKMTMEKTSAKVNEEIEEEKE